MNTETTLNRPDNPGHALIDIHPRSADTTQEVLLIADPLHFPPDLVDRIVRVITELMDLMTAIRRTWSWDSREPGESDADRARGGGLELDTGVSGRFSVQPAAWLGHLRQRILVSLIMRSGKIEAELAWANVDPAAFPPEQIDWFVSRMNALLNRVPAAAKRPFVCTEN